MNKFINTLLYFIIVVLLFGSSGIWVPVILNLTTGKQIIIGDVYQNFSTYLIAIIAAGCVDLIISALKNEESKNKIGHVLLMILILVISLALVFLEFYWIIKEHFDFAIKGIIIGTGLAFILWWISNWKSDKYDSYNTIGGPVV